MKIQDEQQPEIICPIIRDVTDEEVAFYEEHGWALLKGLVDEEFCKKLLASGQDWFERKQDKNPVFNAFGSARPDLFRLILFSDIMGRNAQRLINRKRLSGIDIPLRFRADALGYKLPGDKGVGFHQDASLTGVDRNGEILFWLALDEATPEMGTMQFLSGVHREGSLGASEDLFTLYPRLTELYEFTPRLHYQAGDASIHHGYMVHGSAENTADRPRSSYVFGYITEDAKYWGGRAGETPGAERVVPDTEKHPIAYPK